MTSNWKKKVAAVALAAAMAATSVVSPLVYAADSALQADMAGEPAVSVPACGESVSSEAASNEAASNEAASNEGTSNEATSNEGTSNEGTSNEAASNEATSSEAASSETASSEAASSEAASSEAASNEPVRNEPVSNEPTDNELVEEAAAEEKSEQQPAQQEEDLSWVDEEALAKGWYDGFEKTKEITNEDVKEYWPAGVMPEAWDEAIWPATVSPGMLFEVVPMDGSNVLHVKSDNASGRADFLRWFEGLDYEQDYVLKMRVKTSDFKMNPTGLDNLIKLQVGDRGTKPLTGYTPANGTSDGWMDVEIKMEDLKTAAAGEDQKGMLKIELYPSYMTGEVWIDNLQLVPVVSEGGEPVDPEDPVEMPVKWQTDFSKTQPTSETHWKNGVMPADLPERWIPNAAKGTFWLEVTNDETGSPAIHCHSEDAGARYDIMNTKLYGFDYQKNYVLQAQVKAENVNGTGFYMRAMVGSSANKNLGDGYKVKGTTDGWVLYEIPLQNLAEVAGDNADRMKVEVFFEKFTGDVWVKDLKIVEDYKLSLDKTELTGQVGDVITLNVTADSDKVDLSKLVWTSSDPEIAAVENGTVTIKSVGVATITASMDDTHRVSCTITVDDPAMMEMYATMRKRWTDRQTGNDCVDKNDPDYKAAMASYAEKAQSAWDTLIKDEDRTTLWPDLDLTHKWVKPGQTDGTLTEGMNTASIRIMDMARAWAAEGCEEYGLYHNEELGRDIVEALDWFHANVYNENYDLKKIYGSWWHFWIGVPQNIASACVLMYDEMSPELRASEYATLRHFNEDPTKIVNVWGSYNEQTGANLADTCLVAALRSAVGNNQEGIGLATKHAASLTVNVTSGDGFYEDGSFIQHNNLGYTAGYGSALLKGIEKILYLSNDTAWEMPEESVANVYNWIWNGYRPLYADGAMMDMTTGRGVARPTRTDMGAGRTILEGIVLLADSAPEEMKLPIQIFAKENLIAGAKYSETFYSDMAPASMVAAKKIVNDPNIPSEMTDADEAYYSKVFGVMDKFVAHSEDFSMGISYSSARTGRFEVGNKENIKGWHQGDGVTYMYNGDQNQYSDGYWATIDPQRLPGITTDHNTWTLDTMNAWGKYTGNGIFNGGSAVGPYASVAMDFKNYGSDGSQNPDLAAHKSWFVFDDEVVALGAGITGMKEGRDTETIVENKKINGTNQLVVDGKAVAPNLGDEATLNGVFWAWMEGNKDVDSMGYYFPEGSDVNVLREARTGKWTDVNASAGISDEEITRNYLSLAIPHGENGNSKGEEGYSYVLLPSMKQEQVKSYSENPDIKVLSNTSVVQAVMDTGINASGYNFWQPGQVQLGEQASAFTGVKASQPASVTVAEEGGVLTVGISDPTQKNASTVIRLEGEGLSVGQLGEGVTAQADATGVTLTVNTAGSYGQTFTATVHNTGKVIDDTLEEGNDFLNSDVTTADRADAQALLGRLESLDESQLTAEQAARRTRMMEQLSRMLADMDAVDKAVADLNGVQEVTGDNLEQVKAMLAAYDGLTADQKALLTSEQKAVAEKVRGMVESYETGIEPTPSPDPTPTPGPDATPTPAPNPTPTPKPEDKPSEGGQSGAGTNATPAPTAAPSASAQTGDGFHPVALGLVAVASAAAVAVLTVMKKKASDEE